jgi:hypothetical protein
LKPHKLTLQPGGVTLNELPGCQHGATTGNGDAGGAVSPQPEQIAVRPWITHEQERQALAADTQFFHGGVCFASPPKPERFSLKE